MTETIEQGGPRRPGPALFAVAVFTSAALVFLVQPMLARMLLPLLGGSSMVWNTSLAFFQAALLAGYGYAHLLQRIPSLQRQMIIHLCVLLAAAAVLPLRISGVLGDPFGHAPGLWLVGVLALSVGAPFAALSATAPLIQAWYSRIHGPSTGGRDPYRLYAASNLGSLLALLAYPLAVEPFAKLGAQSMGWSLGYGGFTCIILALIILGWKVRAPGLAAKPPPAIQAVPWRQRMIWLLLAAAPSSLLLGVTGHITADIASAPFLWVAPLALYLVTFIIAFEGRRETLEQAVLLIQTLVLPGALLLFAAPGAHALVQIPVHLLAFFLTAQVCAFALARRRPEPARLTEFYLWMSLGGVLGGAFNAFVAPAIFSGVWEYPIVLILACLARPLAGARANRLQWALLAAAAVSAAALVLLPFDPPAGLRVALMLAPAACALLLRDHPPLLTAALAALAIASYVPIAMKERPQSHRGFFGVIQIKDRQIARAGPMRVMVHGSTVHGAQFLDPARRCQPTTYYTPATPIGQVFAAEQFRRPGMAVATVGLGVGSVAAYTRREDSLTFYEIDPEVGALAFDPANFTFVRGCARGPVGLVLGDARLQLEKAPAASYDLLVIDAFSSDSVPTHLMTEEAMGLYLRLLKPGGVVALHISNRNLDLAGPARTAMRNAGGHSRQQLYFSSAHTYVESSSHVMIAARDEATLEPYARSGRWSYEPHEAPAWTDDYTNVAGALVSRLRGVD